MPRRRRFSTSGYIFHVLNRAVARQTIFSTDGDYLAFQKTLDEARNQVPGMRLLAYCIMPNHWHLVLWPRGDDDLSEYMRWLTVTHTQRWHAFHNTSGTGALYQGRFRSFPVQEDDRFYAVVRYVERNPLRAGLVQHAESWRWSSLWQRVHERFDVMMHDWPAPRGAQWVQCVNEVQSDAELEAVRSSIRRGSPYGDAAWRKTTAGRLGLERTLRSRGRPRKT